MNFRHCISLHLLSFSLITSVLAQDLEILSLGKELDISQFNIIDSQDKYSTGGSTSLRNHLQDHLVWKNQGYFQRNRDLGQVVFAKDNFQMKSIILRTGPSNTAILENTPGSELFLQIFQVVGTPQIHDNLTGPSSQAGHGFTANHRGDDYIIGVEYQLLHTITGGIFPTIPPTRINGNPNPDEEGKLHYIRFLIHESAVKLEKGKRYAIMIGFEKEGKNTGLTLANHNGADHEGVAALGGPGDAYPLGWGVRREGNGQTPPTLHPGETPPHDPVILAKLLQESLFPEFSQRLNMTPTSDGYPDVDTYRDLEFYIEAH